VFLVHGNTQFKSKTHTDGGKNPVWHETFLFERASTSFFLKLQFYDKNTITKDVFIGECKIPLIKALRTRPQDIHVVPVVTKEGTVQGEVLLNLVFCSEELKMMQLEEENSKMRQGLGGAGAVTFARMSGMSRASGGSRVAGVAGLDADPYASGLSERELAMGAEIRRLQEELAAKSKVENSEEMEQEVARWVRPPMHQVCVLCDRGRECARMNLSSSCPCACMDGIQGRHACTASMDDMPGGHTWTTCMYGMHGCRAWMACKDGMHGGHKWHAWMTCMVGIRKRHAPTLRI